MALFFGISKSSQTSFPSCGIVVEGEAGREELVSGNDFGNEVNGDNDEGVGTEFCATKFRRRRGGDIRLYWRNSGRGRASAGRSDGWARTGCLAIRRSTIMFGNISSWV